MIGLFFAIGLLLGVLLTSYVDYKYVKNVCDKCFIDFKNFKHFYKMKSQSSRHKKVKDHEKSRK